MEDVENMELFNRVTPMRMYEFYKNSLYGRQVR